MKLVSINVTFKIEDFWVGVFWDFRRGWIPLNGEYLASSELHIWICLIPCFPIHLVWES